MLKKTLQNHAWSKEYPAKSEWKNILKSIKDPDNISIWITVLPFFLLFLYISISIYDSTAPLITKMFFWSVVLLIISITVYTLNNIAKKNITAQLKYYEINNIQELSLAQAQALQLILCLDYNLAHWNETLEYYPMLGKTNTEDFGGFMVSSAENERHHLHNTWGILLEEEYHDLVEWIFSNGRLTAKFLYKYALKDNGITRLSKLSSISEQKIIDYIEPNDKNVRKLIWGYEFVCVILFTRQAYMAQLISEETAWENILKASSYIHTLFDNFDDFYQNYILGNTIVFENIEIANEHWQQYSEYKRNCHWKFKNLTWHKQNIELPEVVHTAYSIASDYIELEESVPERKIGF